MLTEPSGINVPEPGRYDSMIYRPVGRSGLKVPLVSLGLWHNFGEDTRVDIQREILCTAFDLGITHFDLANNYGPPPGSAERNFGRHLARDFRARRDEMVISTKAGYDMWPGPYGSFGTRKHLLASLDQSLTRLGIDYVDVFYSHRFDPDTPLSETVSALVTACEQGKALYVGISSYSSERTRECAELLEAAGVPLLVHQPSYSMLNRWIEESLLDTLGRLGVGCIAFSPLAQGMLSDRYLDGIPEGSRAAAGKSLSPKFLTSEVVARLRALDEIARSREQSLAQMALAWAVRDPRVSSVLVGASSAAQLRESAAMVSKSDFCAEELEDIDRHAVESGINLWKSSSDT